MSTSKAEFGRRIRLTAFTVTLALCSAGWPSAALGVPSFQTFAQNTGVVANSISINKPTGTVQNDLLLAAISARGSSQSISAPTGWTEWRQRTNGTETVAVFYRVVDATDTGASYTFTLNTSAGVVGAILRYTGVDPEFPVDVAGTDAGTSNTPVAPSVTTNVNDTMVVRIAGIGDNTLSATPATSRVNRNYDPGGGTNDVALGVSDATQASAGATGTADFSLSASDAWVTVTAVLRPFTGTLCANPPGSGTTTLSGTTTVNTYYPGTATANAGAVSISVGTSRGSATAIAAGDLLLVMQMQYADINATDTNSYGDGTAGDPASGATSWATAGQYEFVVAKGAVSGGAVPIEGKGAGGGLLYTYTNANYGTQGQRRFQVVRVPQYYDASITGTVTAAAWNGTSGGVVVLDVAGTLSGTGSINVNALGFRGGGGRGLTGGGTNPGTTYRSSAANNYHAPKAEGVAGSAQYMYDGTGTLVNTGVEGYPNGSHARGAPGNAGGGGTDYHPTANDENSGGGGGGNGGAGGKGGNSWSSNQPVGGFSGAAFPYAAAKLAMGGGGGAGSRNNSEEVQSSGGLGGGIIMIRANSVTGAVTLSASGGWPATDTYTPENDGAGGGGAGGSVLVFARTGVLTSLTINANGANGANAWPTEPWGTDGINRHGPGGGGAGGVVCLSSSAGTTSVTGGANGTSTAALDAFGATSGSPGATCTVTEASIPGASSGATCKATLASLTDFGATLDGGQVVLHWVTRFETGTVGFHLERLDPVSRVFERITTSMLPGLITSPQGGTYEYIDPDVWPDEAATYRLIEVEAWGSQRIHGPYTVRATSASPRLAAASFQKSSLPDPGQGQDDPKRGYRAIPHALQRKVSRREAGFKGATSSTSVTSGQTLMARAFQTAEVVAGEAAQVTVVRDGLYSLSADNLATVFNTTEDQVRKWIAHRRLQLTNAGQPVAWTPLADKLGILFYGQAIDSLYTRDNVYRVEQMRGIRMRGRKTRRPASEPAGAFTETLKYEEDRFAATIVATDPESDYWFWQGFIGNTPGWSSKSFTLDAPDVVGGGSLQIGVSGAAASDHAVEVWLNGTRLGDGTWTGLGGHIVTVPVDNSALQSGDNTLEVRALGTSENLFYLDRIELIYQRLARAVQDRLILQADNDGPLAVDGFTAPEILVFDITNPQRPVRLRRLTVAAAHGGYSVTFKAKEENHYLVLAEGAIEPAAAQGTVTTNLKTADPMDYAIITTPAMASAAQALADYRTATFLRGRVVLIDEIYDNFNFGIVSPHGIREFLRYAEENWGLRYAVLAGIGTFDYRNLFGFGEEQVPTLMTGTPFGLYACDGCLGDLDGDSLPDLVVSRIPAGSAEDLQTYVAKVMAYEQDETTLGGAGVLMLADAADAEAGDFPADSDEVAELLPPEVAVEKIYLSEYDLATARTLTFDRLEAGVGWVNYVGHGNVDRMSSAGLITTGDVGGMASVGILPVVSALTCAVNRFELPGYTSLGEELVLQPDGGAIAIWAPTGLSLNTPAVELDESLFKVVFQFEEPVLGDATQQSLQASAGVVSFMPRIYNLLGDAALLLRH